MASPMRSLLFVLILALLVLRFVHVSEGVPASAGALPSASASPSSSSSSINQWSSSKASASVGVVISGIIAGLCAIVFLVFLCASKEKPELEPPATVAMEYNPAFNSPSSPSKPVTGSRSNPYHLSDNVKELVDSLANHEQNPNQAPQESNGDRTLRGLRQPMGRMDALNSLDTTSSATPVNPRPLTVAPPQQQIHMPPPTQTDDDEEVSIDVLIAQQSLQKPQPSSTPSTISAPPPASRPVPPSDSKGPLQSSSSHRSPPAPPVDDSAPPPVFAPKPTQSVRKPKPGYENPDEVASALDGVNFPSKPFVDPLFGGNTGPSRSIDPLFGSSKNDDNVPSLPPKPAGMGDYDLPPPRPEKKSHLNLTSAENQDSMTDFDAELAPWQIVRSRLHMANALGEGFFGAVSRGSYLDQQGHEIPVAVKTLHADRNKDKEKKAFLMEAVILGEFRHPNVLWLVGVSTRAKPWLILCELAPFGDLKKLLNKCEEANIQLTIEEQLRLLKDVCGGMSYLASRQFIHRDLAARNCLVGSQGEVKIGDFGMSRLVAKEDDYYKAKSEDALPMRWMAVESLEHNKFTLKSDVWSFGVVMYEVFSYGDIPYGELSPIVIAFKIPDGLRPAQPMGCPDDMYSVMQECWNADPRLRPAFSTLLSRISTLHKDALSNIAKPRLLNEVFAEAVGIKKEDPYRSLNPSRKPDQAPLEPGDIDRDPDPYKSLSSHKVSEDVDKDGGDPYKTLTKDHRREVAGDQDKDGGDPYKRLAPGYRPDQSAAGVWYPSMHQVDDAPLASDVSNPDSRPWFHGNLSRTGAERVLMSQGNLAELDGTYLVRQSNKVDGGYVISVIASEAVWHYKVQQLEGARVKFLGVEYDDFESLIRFHQVFRSENAPVLRIPCSKF